MGWRWWGIPAHLNLKIGILLYFLLFVHSFPKVKYVISFSNSTKTKPFAVKSYPGKFGSGLGRLGGCVGGMCVIPLTIP